MLNHNIRHLIRPIGFVQFVVFVLFLHLEKGHSVTLSENGYSQLLVWVSSDLDSSQCDNYINNIKTLMESASQHLYTATNNRLYIKDVIILVPESWSCSGVTIMPENYYFEEASVRLGPAHALFGNDPWTQQLRFCGEPGNFIYLSDTFIKRNSNETGHLFLHEWAKYRWGVFEEYGHEGDPIYPPAFRNSVNVWSPNLCSNSPVPGNDISSCQVEENCTFIINKDESENITSSIASLRDLPKVQFFCDQNNHNQSVPTKQNLMCGSKSAWEVMNAHSDFIGSSSNGPVEPILFYITQGISKNNLRVAIGLENTFDMYDLKGRYDFLNDSLRQFIGLEISLGSEIALYTFTEKKEIIQPLTTIKTSEDRQNVIKNLSNIHHSSENTHDVLLAVETGAELLKTVSDGIILLITQTLSSTQYPPSLDLVDAADDHPVWVILYPHDLISDTTVFQELTSATGGVLTTIDNEIIPEIKDKGYQHPHCRFLLSDTLRNLQLSVNPKTATRAYKEVQCSASCNDAVSIPSNYAEDFQVNFYNKFGTTSSVQVYPPSQGPIEQSTSTHTFVAANEGESIAVTITAYNDDPVLYELIGIPSSLTSDVRFQLSQDMKNVVFSTNDYPVMFIEVFQEDRTVIDASVRVTVKSSDDIQKTLTLADNGVGADVTGNDGVYSGYLLGLTSIGEFELTVEVDDNDGTAKLVPDHFDGSVNQICCGSKLKLPFTTSKATPFNNTITKTGISKSLPPIKIPPSDIKDLTATQDNFNVNLQFTAPGGDLDYGNVSSYAVKYYNEKENTLFTNYKAQSPAGTKETIIFRPPQCATMLTYTVIAKDAENVTNQESNPARLIVPCEETGVSAGVIAGIAIAAALLIILIIIIIYLCINRDNRDDNCLWYYLTCGCCYKKKAAKTSSVRTDDIIRPRSMGAQPIRSLADLYDTPSSKAPSQPRLSSSSVSDDGGFNPNKDIRTSRHSLISQSSLEESVKEMAVDTVFPHSRGSGGSLDTPINTIGIPLVGMAQPKPMPRGFSYNLPAQKLPSTEVVPPVVPAKPKQKLNTQV